MPIWIIILSFILKILSGYGSDRQAAMLDWQADFYIVDCYSLPSGDTVFLECLLTPLLFPIAIIDFWAGPPLGSEPYCLKCEVLPCRCFLLSGQGTEMEYRRICSLKTNYFEEALNEAAFLSNTCECIWDNGWIPQISISCWEVFCCWWHWDSIMLSYGNN